MEQLERRTRFLLDDLHQVMALPGDTAFNLAVIDAYRSLTMLLDVMSYKRVKK